MRRLLSSMLICATLSSVLSLSAQDTPKQNEAPRFAFFTLGLLVENSVKAKKIFLELENTQKTLNDKLKAKGDEGQKLQQQLQGGSLSDQGRELIKKQLRDVDFEYKKLQEDSQIEYDRVQKKVLGEIYKHAGPIIEALAREQKLQVVLSGESAQAGQLIHWADDVWVRAFSLEVAKRLDASDLTAAKPVVVPATKPSVKPAVPPANPPVIKKP